MNDHTQLDRRKALQWLEGDERMLARIKVIFTKNIPSQVESLRASLNANDNAVTERLAHTIMGSAAMLGASAMSEAAAGIERYAIGGDADSARLHFAKFVEEYEKVMAELASDGGAV